MKKQIFTLTEADMYLLAMLKISFDTYSYPMRDTDTVFTNRTIRIWNVLGEKHGFKPETAEKHPDGEPKILAEPVEPVYHEKH